MPVSKFTDAILVRKIQGNFQIYLLRYITGTKKSAMLIDNFGSRIA